MTAESTPKQPRLGTGKKARERKPMAEVKEVLTSDRPTTASVSRRRASRGLACARRHASV